MKYLLPLLGLLVVIGAGCSSDTPGTNAVNDPVVRSIAVGDTLIVAEGASVVKGAFEDKSVERRLTFTSFEMGKASTGDWRLVDASDTGRELDRGSWFGMTLNTAHPFSLPGIITSTNFSVGDTSLLVLGREEYRELTNTAGTTIDPRFLEDPTWADRMKAHPPANRAFGALQALAREALAKNVDLVFARKEQEKGNFTLRINGAEETVPVIRLKNWYGTYEVWDREGSPVVLSFALAPQVEANRLDVTSGDGAELAKLVNYRVTGIEYKVL